MHVTPAHRTVAEKFVFQKDREDAFVPDSLLDLVTFLYSAEEAEVVAVLGFVGLPARAIARRLKRPVREVRPILEALSQFNIPTIIAKSHFEAVIDPGQCVGCSRNTPPFTFQGPGTGRNSS